MGTNVAEQRNEVAGGVRAAIAAGMSSATSRTIAAFVSAALSMLGTSGGLMVVLGDLQAALVVGIAAGVVAPSRRSAGLSATLAWGLGAMLGPTNPLAGAPTTSSRLGHLIWFVAAAGVAMGVQAVATRPGVRRWLTWVVVGVVVANMFWTSYSANSKEVFDPNLQRGVPSMFAQLAGQIPPEYSRSDEYFYLKVIRRVDQGAPYYTAFGEEHGKHFGKPILSPLMVREPLAFWLWSLLPGVGSNLIWLYLTVAGLAVASVPVLLRRVLVLPLAIPAVCLTGAYLLYAAVGIHVLALEPWAGALGLITLALVAVAGDARQWSRAEVFAAGIAMLAALLRELMLVLPLAGLLAVYFDRGDRLRRRLTIWAVAVLLALLGIGVHWTQASKLVSASGSMSIFFNGGWANLVSGLGWGATFFGDRGAIVAALALAGVVGAAAIRDPRLQAMALMLTVGPIVLFLVAGNGSIDPVFGTPNNYWGAAYLPLMIAFAPAGLAWLPGLAAPPRRDS